MPSASTCRKILPPVMADRQRIVQVLNNLFSNAARHSPDSSSDPCRRRARRHARGGLGSRRGPGRAARRSCPTLFRKQADVAGRRPGARRRRFRSRPRHLQGARRGARRPHLGRERRSGPGHAVHLHRAGGRRGTGRRRRRRPAPIPRAAGSPRANAHPRGRRRSADAALRPGRAGGGRLCPAADGRPGGAVQPGQDAQAPAGPAGPAAARCRRDRVDGAHSRAGRPPGHLHLRLRAGTRRSRGRWMREPQTTSSSPSRRRS